MNRSDITTAIRQLDAIGRHFHVNDDFDPMRNYGPQRDTTVDWCKKFKTYEEALRWFVKRWEPAIPKIIRELKDVYRGTPRYLRNLASPSGASIRRAAVYGVRGKPRYTKTGNPIANKSAPEIPSSIADIWEPSPQKPSNWPLKSLKRGGTERWWPNVIARAYPTQYPAVMKQLNGRQQAVFVAYFIENKLISEVADALGMTTNRVDAILGQIRHRFSTAGLPFPEHLTKRRISTVERSLK
jgi:hypothetical protein